MSGFHAAVGLPGALAFVVDYFDAPAGADILFGVGRPDEAPEQPMVLLSVNGSTSAFMPAQARMLADMFEQAMRRFPSHPQSAGLPDLILWIREAAWQAETETPAGLAAREGRS